VSKTTGSHPSPNLDTTGAGIVSHAGATLLVDTIHAMRCDRAVPTDVLDHGEVVRLAGPTYSVRCREGCRARFWCSARRFRSSMLPRLRLSGRAQLIALNVLHAQGHAH
jgi:hypothetical protein